MGYPGGGEDVEKMVKLALKNGYRHFDTVCPYFYLPSIRLMLILRPLDTVGFNCQCFKFIP